MKIAFYMEDGLEQIVLTPESDFEKSMLGKLHDGRDLSIKRGSFYECQGGWVRQRGGDDTSTMLVLRPHVPPETLSSPKEQD